ncbi:hypothetical protein VPH35_137876 [Triticum aestivum]
MDQGQGVTVTESLVTEMAQRLRTPAPEVDASVVCLISWAGSDGFDRRDYEPANVRIGPFHRDPSHPTENEKKDALHRLLPQDDEQGRAEDLNHYLHQMARVVPRARGCYSRWFSTIDTEEFKCMLLVDGCFLHSRFVPSRAAPAPVNDDITVDRDTVFLLENQLPFFVLVEVQRLIRADAEDSYSVVVDNVLGRIQALVRLNEYSAVTVPRPTTPPCHLLHLLYMYFRPTALPLNDAPAPAIRRTRSAVAAAPPPSSQPAQIPLLPLGNNQGAAANGNGAANEVIPPPPPGAPVCQTRWRAATYYHTAGVRFMARKVGSGDGEARSILDVERRGDWLHIPILAVDNNTFRMLRNMVALEQNSPQLPRHGLLPLHVAAGQHQGRRGAPRRQGDHRAPAPQRRRCRGEPGRALRRSCPRRVRPGLVLPQGGACGARGGLPRRLEEVQGVAAAHQVQQLFDGAGRPRGCRPLLLHGGAIGLCCAKLFSREKIIL